VLRANGGDDSITAGNGLSTLIQLTLDGGAGNDTIIGGDGADTLLGGDGIDTAEVNGSNGAEVFTATANGTRVRFDRLDPAPFFLDIGTTENLVVNMNGGNDSFSATGNLATLIKVTVDGGTGDDTILGSNGDDLLMGGADNDFIDGQQGSDAILLGSGDDTAQWDPGDGSDTIEGGAGNDKLIFNGSNGAEAIALSANGGRVLMTRNLGNIVMDLDDVETIDVNAFGAADSITVNDLGGTDVTTVNVNLLANGVGDGQPDTVTARATNGDDIVQIVGAGSSVAVTGLAAQINITGAEGANDTMVVEGLGGDDSITATTLPAGCIKLNVGA
jgi:Ca2+-binding RTX toxin-like protein